jgi:hypothetical protein
MTRRLWRAAAALVATFALAACNSDTAFTGAAPVSYDGVWRGTTTREHGSERHCLATTPFVLTITNNRVVGEVRDRRNRDATVARFDALVDADGRLTARAWYDGVPHDLALEYNGSRFSGQITTAEDCVYFLRLSRDRA